MRRFVVRNHRDRKKLTLTAVRKAKKSGRAHSVSVTLTLPGKRVIELSDKVCRTYTASLGEYVRAGALIALDPEPPPAPDPLLSTVVLEDEVDEDPAPDEDEDAEA